MGQTPNNIRVTKSGKMRNRYRLLVGKPGGMRPLVRTRYGWEDNTETDIQKIEYRRTLVQEGTSGGLLGTR
jgi:hypothetical protein